jgi:NAD(P)-dependent dehydrogenase (short-subunit alcohol dehydrogenase family)
MTGTRPIAVVTGAGRGIGRATALELAAAGYDVCINYRGRHDAAGQTLDEILAAGGSGWLSQADVSCESSVMTMFEAVDARQGVLKALVNNAGIVFPQSGLTGMSADRMRQVMNINVIGSMLCAREAVRRMSRRLGGAGGGIVNVSSVASRLGAPNEYLDYAASKGAIDAFTIGLAAEEAPHGIRVNAVRPGIIETDIHGDAGEPGRPARVAPSLPMRRAGTAREVAMAIAWLLSDQAAYVHGAILDVSGGR